MEDKNRLEEILSKNGFKKQDGVVGIPITIRLKDKYSPLNSLIESCIKNGNGEYIIQITKMKDSKAYLCEIYSRE